jgi:hypothetical protein
MSTFNSPNIQILTFKSFEELTSTDFHGDINAMCWLRKIQGDFSEIVEKVELESNMVELDEEELQEMELSFQGRIARDILISDLKLLKELGASPVINVIKHYERDDSYPNFPTDVYSYHVDRSPIPTSTFLCTYHGATSDILPNHQAKQKILIPEIRKELRKLYTGKEDGFHDFLEENFFDLHYIAKEDAKPINLGLGNMWKLSVDHPESKVLPCVHRAPLEQDGKKRLLLIC